MGAMRNKMEDTMLLLGYSPKTRKSYLGQMRLFVTYFKRSPEHLNEKDVEKYLLYVIKNRFWKPATVNQARAAIVFFYRKVLDIDNFGSGIAKQKLPVRKPVILSREEVRAMLGATENIKHRAILMVAYSAGLRVSELVNLRIEDIDSKRMLIRVAGGKGKKDRYTILSQSALTLLREYYRVYRPKVFLFPGNSKEKPYSVRSAETLFKEAIRRAKIIKNLHIHNLRHSFATHMLEDGVSLPHIQQMLGHASPRTTGIYLAISENDFRRFRSPLDYFYDTRVADG
jgi:integrase/recombinase XerD